MSSKTFLTISKKECLVVYKDIIGNSDKKWEAGNLLASHADFGAATSMAIISVEELVKSMVVYLDGKGFEFRSVKGMDTIFKHHQVRYLLAYAMFAMGVFGDELMKFIEKVRQNPNDIIRLNEEMKKDKEEFFRKNMQRYMFRKFIQLRNEFDWFSKVDIFRQDGFYSDYEEQLKNPIKISPDDYGQVIQRLEKVRNVGKGIIEAFENQDEDTQEQFKEIKRDFKQKNYYEKIGNSLTKVRQSRESPLI